MFGFDDDDGFSAMEAGAMYALYRHGQDVQTQQIVDGLRGFPIQQTVDVHVHTGEEDELGSPANNLDFVDPTEILDDWDDYVGQQPLKDQVRVRMVSAQRRGDRFPHTLLASGYPGVGKTAMARLIAKTMGKHIIELVPPFKVTDLVTAALKLDDGDILFIDEIHKLADNGKQGAELLLKVLEEGVAFLPTGPVDLPDLTVIGATTDRDKLPEPVVDRFKIKPYFQAYSIEELAEIATIFAYRHDAEQYLPPRLAGHIAVACRGTPRIAEEMVLAARDLGVFHGRPATPQELLTFLEVEPDGLTRTHIHYITAMYQYFARETKDGGIEYIIGEAAIQQILRETKQGIGRVERFLVERGLVDRTPRGRRLTEQGILRAQEFIYAGKGVSEIA